MHNIAKIALGAILTIFLGALGSGLWELVFSPTLSYLSSSLTEIISSVSNRYADSIYINASTIEYHGQAGLVLLFMVLILSAAMLYKVSSRQQNRFFSNFHYVLKNEISGWGGLVFASSMFLTAFIFMSTQSSVFQVRKYSVKQMHILRPYIGDEKFHHLYSQYLQIRSKADFDVFLIQVQKYSQDHKVKIDEFKL